MLRPVSRRLKREVDLLSFQHQMLQGLWLWLPHSPALRHDDTKLELSVAWEPLDSSSSHQYGEKQETPSCVSYGNQDDAK
jgi:hypothetical protein